MKYNVKDFYYAWRYAKDGFEEELKSEFSQKLFDAYTALLWLIWNKGNQEESFEEVLNRAMENL